MPKHAVKPKNVLTLDLTELVPRLCLKLDVKRHKLVSLLKDSEIDGEKFNFVYDDTSYFRVYVKCPSCKKNKIKLYKLENEWGCADCQHLARPARRQEKRISVVYARYIRPLLKLKEINDKLFSETLTNRQRQILHKKAEKLRKVIPEYIYNMREIIVDAFEKNKAK